MTSIRRACGLQGAAQARPYGLALPCQPRAPVPKASRQRAAAVHAALATPDVRRTSARPGLAALGRSRRRTLAVSAVFEKFNERSIKSVMIAQKTAKELGASEVRQRMEKLARRLRGAPRRFRRRQIPLRIFWRCCASASAPQGAGPGLPMPS
jgi:hypothetical protein